MLFRPLHHLLGAWTDKLVARLLTEHLCMAADCVYTKVQRIVVINISVSKDWQRLMSIRSTNVEKRLSDIFFELKIVLP